MKRAAAMPSGYAIGQQFEQFIRQHTQSGRYARASEVVREALRILANLERLRQIELEEYRAKIREGIESLSVPADEMFTRLEAKYQAMADQKA
ncbi:MAG: type II toxin-antitoxin system ParD family antitoxin [Methylococcus sp.]|nr:type II toxin-antitoxin system ParD family antitoxin [Methylococcus sp.]